MIQVGDRVVCVDAKRWPTEDSECPLTEGYEYIVRDIHEHGHGDKLGFAVDIGFVSPTFECYCGRCNYRYPNGPKWFCILRFRKVEERTIEYTVDVKIEIPEPCLS